MSDCSIEIRKVIRNPATCKRIKAVLEQDGLKPTEYVMRLVYDDLKKRDAINSGNRCNVIPFDLYQQLKLFFEQNK